MFDRSYADLVVGDVTDHGPVPVSEEQVLGYTDLVGEQHPLHRDPEFAARSRFGARIAPGLLVLSVALATVPFGVDTVLALTGMDRVRFRRPTYLGDRLRTRVTVLDKAERPAGGLVTAGLQVHNQQDELLAEAVVEVLLARPAPPVPVAAAAPERGTA